MSYWIEINFHCLIEAFVQIKIYKKYHHILDLHIRTTCLISILQHLLSWVKFGFRQSASVEVKGFKTMHQSLLCFSVCSRVSTGQTRKYSHKERAHTVFALLSSAQWLMKDQKPQRLEALDLCILFPLNINTLVRQMRLQRHCPAAEATIH